MQSELDWDQKKALAEKLHEIVDEMLAPHGKTSPHGITLTTEIDPPFDYSKPNQHNSKVEFLDERAVVEKSISHIEALLDLMLPDKSAPERRAVMDALKPRLDKRHREQSVKIPVDDAMSIVRRNAALVGGTYTFLWLLTENLRAFRGRLDELNEQEERFWSARHRPPDHFAREIALRLARLFAREVRQRPTLGTSGIHRKPSTDYARAVARIFEVLGITAQPRSPAEWAIAQITDDDLKPPAALFGGVLGLNPFGLTKPRNALADLKPDKKGSSD